MVNDAMVESETPPLRPREVIEADIELIKSKEAEIGLKYDALTQEQKEQFDILASRIERETDKKAEQITDEMLSRAISDPANPVDLVVGEFARFYLGGLSRLASFNKEFTPYIKEDFEKLIMDISSRLDYDKMFDVIRDSNGDISLFSMNHILYLLRRYQHDYLMPSDERQDYDYYDTRVYELKKLLAEWSEQGFLTDQPKPDYEINPEFGESVKVRRKGWARYLEPFLEELSLFNDLSYTYKPSIQISAPFDYPLEAVYMYLFNFNKDNSSKMYTNFEQIDFDPELVQAAARHMFKVLDAHERAGHLHNYHDETTEAERQRIESLDLSEIVRGIQFEGFGPPEGKESVVSIEDITNELLLSLPPDFLYQLRTIAIKDKPEKIDEDDPTKETMGQYLPSYDPTCILGGSAAVNQVSTSNIFSYGVKNPRHFLGVEFNLYSKTLISPVVS